jgi:hypothetical protein
MRRRRQELPKIIVSTSRVALVKIEVRGNTEII